MEIINNNNNKMCGIWGLFYNENVGDMNEYYKKFMNLKSRGPDSTIYNRYDEPYNMVIGFHRLAIRDLSFEGNQPFVYNYIDKDKNKKTIITICNGEIYNYEEMKMYCNDIKSQSDCEIIHHLYIKYGFEKTMEMIRGEYAIILIDLFDETGKMDIYISRDPLGIRPLFYVKTKKEKEIEKIMFSSEIKGLKYDKERVKIFPPGNYIHLVKENDPRYIIIKKKVKYYQFEKSKLIENNLSNICENIRNMLIRSVENRCHSDVDIGCFLSGGLDSSLVAAIASRYLKNKGKKLYTFSIGMEESTDEKYAKMVSQHIGSVHKHVHVDYKHWLEKLPQIVKISETYDITTIRATTGQYLLAEWIKMNHPNIKVILIGDGSDELCSGYLYFHKSPSPDDSHNENIKLLKYIHCFDVLRADRGIASNGLESRVPFLDIDFVDYYLSINKELRIPRYGIEKWLLRFSFSETNILPNDVLWRKKEAFSDGVSSLHKSWYSMIEEFINDNYQTLFVDPVNYGKYSHCKPLSLESYYYRFLFDLLYGNQASYVVPYFWLPKWCGEVNNPSARILSIYNNKSN